MALSAEEKKLLKRLQRKADEPDAPAVGKSLNISVDLGDERQVERAQKLGLLGSLLGADDADDDGDDDDGDDDGADDDDDDTPRRRGYFRESQ